LEVFELNVLDRDPDRDAVEPGRQAGDDLLAEQVDRRIPGQRGQAAIILNQRGG
jgi:hypothetical protein